MIFGRMHIAPIHTIPPWTLRPCVVVAMFQVLSSAEPPVPLETLSDYFASAGQEAKLSVSVQPRLAMENDQRDAVAPVISVVDGSGTRLPLANTKVRVTLGRNVNAAEFSPKSMTMSTAAGGMAVFDKLWLTRAASKAEPGPNGAPDRSTGVVAGYTLVFDADGFEAVESSDFFVLPELSFMTTPSSERTIVIKKTCSGYSKSDPAKSLPECATTLSQYIDDTDVLRSATVDIDLVCTDFDSPGEVVRSVMVGNTQIQPGVFNTGPWMGCAFAGCRDQCASNMRYVSQPRFLVYVCIHIYIHTQRERCPHERTLSWCW
jgi:hypothetical protein